MARAIALAFARRAAKARGPVVLAGRETEVTQLVPLDTIDAGAVERLLDRAFGADRHLRTAYRIRAGTRPIAALSLAAMEDRRLVGTIQCWPVALDTGDASIALAMVGPVAVDPDRQRDGVGRSLMSASLDAAARHGLDRALVLIGDPDYYDRFFGFSAERTALWQVPGPVDRHRLLARGDLVPAVSGMLRARIEVPV